MRIFAHSTPRSYNTGYVQIKGNVEIKDEDGNVIGHSLTIPSGVTLLLPYGNTTNDRNTSGTATLDLIGDDSSTPNVNESQYYVLANSLPERYRMTWVKLAENVILNVNGTLEISGEMTGGGGGTMSGHTAGRYATLELMSGAEINVSGLVNCYGFIENVEGNENGRLTVNSGGNIYVPFVLIDFKGGTIMSAIAEGMTNYGYAPFHQFNFPNVSVTLKIKYGGKMSVWCNLEAGSQTNSTEGVLVGKDSSVFIELTDDKYSYLEAKYDPSTCITSLKIVGGARLNALSLTVEGTTVKSSDFLFGLSWLYHITLDNNSDVIDNYDHTCDPQSTATFVMPHSYKMLPGSKLTVESGATLEVGTLTIYTAESFDDRLGGVYPNTGLYPEVYPSMSSLKGTTIKDAWLMVRGHLRASNLGGNVNTDIGNATVIVSGSSSVTSYEVTTVNKGTLGLAGVVGEHQIITRYAKLVYCDSNGKEISAVSSIIQGATFTSDATVNRWTTDYPIEYITITLPEGVHITIDSIVKEGANGGLYFDSYDSSAGGEINIVEGTVVTFHLKANQLLVPEGPKDQYALASSGDIKTSDYTYEWPASDAVFPAIYTVPVLNLSGHSGMSSTTITYKSLLSTPYIEVVFTKTHNAFNLIANASITISGIANGNAEVTQSSVKPSGNKYSSSGLTSATVSVTLAVYKDASITATAAGSSSTPCVTPDTLVTLADGSQKRIDEVTYDDLILVWNFYEGKYDVVPSALIQNHGYGWNGIVKFTFSDGTVTKAVNEHGYFDATLNEFVMITPHNALEYIGHEFIKAYGDSYTTVNLISVEIYEEYVESYSILTAYYYNFITDNMFSLTSPVIETNFFMPFEVGENMTFDAEKMEEDIAKYGLYEYADFENEIPYEVFDALNIKYLKVAVGKGLITYDQIIELLKSEGVID